MRRTQLITTFLAATLVAPVALAGESRLKNLPELPPPPLRLELPHGFVLQPIAHIQLWATPFDMDDAEKNDPIVRGDPDHREGFSIRRARVGVAAAWNDLLGVSLLLGWNDRYDALQSRPTGPSLVDATFRFTPWDEFGVQAGYGRVAFGRQLQISSNNLSLHERAMVSEVLGPPREPGMVFLGAVGPEGEGPLPSDAFKYQVSVTNGSSDFTGDLDPAPRLAARVSLDLGSSWENSEPNWDLPPFGLSVGGGVMQNWALEANTTTAGADLGVRVWRFTILGEFAWQRAVPTFDTEGVPEVLAQRDSLGVYGHIGATIIPDWLDVSVRVDYLDDYTALKDAGDRLDIMGGVGLYLFSRHLKVQLDYVHREELTAAAKTNNDSLVILMQARL